MTDIRIINTKNRIRMGMINALKEKPLNEVTTKDIIEAAEVSRKTFYTYYNDQNYLLFEIENAMISDLVEGMKKDREAVTQLDDTADQVEIATSWPTKPLSRQSRPALSTAKLPGSCFLPMVTLTSFPKSKKPFIKNSWHGHLNWSQPMTHPYRILKNSCQSGFRLTTCLRSTSA